MTSLRLGEQHIHRITEKGCGRQPKMKKSEKKLVDGI